MQSLRLLEVLLSRPRRGDLQASGITDPAIPTLGSTFQQDVTGTTIPSRGATAKHRRLRPTWHGPTNRILRPWSLPIRSLTSPPKSPRWDHPNYSKRRVERFLKATREYRIVVNILQVLFVSSLHGSLDFAPFPVCFFDEPQFLPRRVSEMLWTTHQMQRMLSHSYSSLCPHLHLVHC